MSEAGVATSAAVRDAQRLDAACDEQLLSAAYDGQLLDAACRPSSKWLVCAWFLI